MTTKYITKRIFIDAIQWNGKTGKYEIDRFTGVESKLEMANEKEHIQNHEILMSNLIIDKKGSVLKIFPSDYIVKCANGKLYRCDEKTFNETYDIVE